MKLRAAYPLLLTILFLSLFLILADLLFLRHHFGGATPATFTNRSESILHAATISGSGFKATIGDIYPGRTGRVFVYPSGESSLRISFSANDKVVDLPMDVYLEGGGGYTIGVTINSKLHATVATDFSPWWGIF